MSTIGEIKIDFYVFSLDTKSLLIGDISTWNSAENKPALISITPPGSKNPVKLNFAKYKVNGFNSNTLNLTCVTECGEQNYVELSDGVWEVLLEASPSSFNKKRYYLKTDQITTEIAKIYIKAGLEYDVNNKQLRNDLEDIDFLIEQAKAATVLGDKVKAERNFEMAIVLLKKYQECKDCI
jgi:hypothetical protein